MRYKKPETYYNEKTIRSVYRYKGESEIVTDDGQQVFAYVGNTPYLAVRNSDGNWVAGDPVFPVKTGSSIPRITRSLIVTISYSANSFGMMAAGELQIGTITGSSGRSTCSPSANCSTS